MSSPPHPPPPAVLQNKSAALPPDLLLLPPVPVPFVESPKYAPQRRESSRTLALPQPHPFLRANSDSSMNLPDWMAVPNAPGTNIVSVQVGHRGGSRGRI